MTEKKASVIGAGLAGSEAAWQLAEKGIAVTLYEMKPAKMTPAHRSPYFGELVCSNSLRSGRLENAAGLLKEELRRLGSGKRAYDILLDETDPELVSFEFDSFWFAETHV